MLRSRLLESGVEDGQVQIIPDERSAVDAALNMAQENDLVVIFGDNIQRCWKQVAGFKTTETETSQRSEGKLATSFVEADPEAFTLEPGAALIRDERGVRIAKMDEESD
jgi:cyanophycin synthetase